MDSTRIEKEGEDKERRGAALLPALLGRSVRWRAALGGAAPAHAAARAEAAAAGRWDDRQSGERTGEGRASSTYHASQPACSRGSKAWEARSPEESLATSSDLLEATFHLDLACTAFRVGTRSKRAALPRARITLGTLDSWMMRACGLLYRAILLACDHLPRLWISAIDLRLFRQSWLGPE